MSTVKNLGCFVILLAAVLAGLAFSQKDNLRGFVRSHLTISLDKAKLDLAGLLEKDIRGKIRLNVYNSLPLGATLENLTYAIFLNNQEIGSGFQTAPRTAIVGMATSSLEIVLSLDAGKTRQALQGTNAKQALQLIGSLVDQLKKKKVVGAPPGEGQLRVVGQANFQVLAGSVEIPLDRTAAFERGF